MIKGYTIAMHCNLMLAPKGASSPGTFGELAWESGVQGYPSPHPSKTLTMCFFLPTPQSDLHFSEEIETTIYKEGTLEFI